MLMIYTESIRERTSECAAFISSSALFKVDRFNCEGDSSVTKLHFDVFWLNNMQHLSYKMQFLGLLFRRLVLKIT